MRLPIFYVRADLPEGVKHLVTCNAGERLSRGGKLPSELIMGVVLKPSEDFNSGVRPDNFGTNTTFVHFLQQIIGQYGPDTVQLRVNAESIENGTLYVVDERAPVRNPISSGRYSTTMFLVNSTSRTASSCPAPTGPTATTACCPREVSHNWKTK